MSDSPELLNGPLEQAPRKILQVPGLVVILYEKSFVYRPIFTDGWPLPADPIEPKYSCGAGIELQ
jgi:hypothetical protein